MQCRPEFLCQLLLFSIYAAYLGEDIHPHPGAKPAPELSKEFKFDSQSGHI